MAENIFVAVSVAVIWLVVRLIACFRIYDNAKSRGMKAGRWALGAAITLIPTVLVYVIVRKEKVKSVCQNCGKIGYNNWRFCPDCSTPIEIRNEKDVPKTEKVFFAFAMVFSIAFAVLTAIFLVLVLTGSPVSTVNLTKQDVSDLQLEVYSWIEECDKDEENDIFILDSDRSIGLIVYTKGWIETDDILNFEAEESEEKTTVKILLPEEKSKNKEAYNISYFDTLNAESLVYAEDFCVYSGEELLQVKATKIDADFDIFADWYFDIEDLPDEGKTEVIDFNQAGDKQIDVKLEKTDKIIW